MEQKILRSTFYPDFFACLLLAAMVFWFNHETIWSSKVPFFRDLATYHYPNRFILARSFQAGEFPLWSTQISMGYPFSANPPAGVFYPPHIIFLLLSFFNAIRFLFVFHYLIAATGSYFLCRQWNYPPYLALLGSILFAFGGMVISLSNMMDYFETAVWLPWILFWGERSVRSQSWKDWIPLTFVLLTQFLAGHPETYVMSSGLLLLDGLRIGAQQKIIRYGKLISLLFAANVLVVGLAMVQILPAIELFLQSSRSDTLPYAKAVAWSLNPLSLINLFFLDKEVNLQLFNGLHLFFAQEPPLILSLYMGIVALYGILLWSFVGSLKERFFVFGLLLLFLALALGGYTSLYSFFRSYIPVAGFFRFPQKFLFPFCVLLLFVALRGLYGFLEHPSPSRRSPLLAVALVPLLVSLLYIFLRLDGGLLVRFIAWSKQTALLDPSTLDSFSAVLISLERQIVLMLGTLLLLFLWKKQRLRKTLFQTLLVGLAFFDLASAHRPYHFFLNPDLVPTTQRIASPATNEPYRLFYILRPSDLHPNNYAFTKRPFDEIISSVFATLIPNAGVFYGFDYMQELDSLRKKPYDLFVNLANRLPPERLYRLLGALNVKYINSFGSLPARDIALVGHFPEYPSWLYRIDRFVPRAYIVPKASEEKEPEKILERLSSEEFNPLQEVILEQPLRMAAQKKFEAQVKIVRYTNRNAVIQTALNGSGILVLADSYYPGWRVYVDGKEQEILRANLFFRGVPLSAGEHVVEFRYEPWSFKIGLALSLMTLLGVAGFTASRYFSVRR